jgi:exopolyphosphatase/pppGpp-phosphohydrolase
MFATEICRQARRHSAVNNRSSMAFDVALVIGIIVEAIAGKDEGRLAKEYDSVRRDFPGSIRGTESAGLTDAMLLESGISR